MIDLSHLTEEEKNMILEVLKRDAELKLAEEERIRSLQKSVSDKAKLKYLTGDWFYETKSKRHQDRIHGSDIIRASMRQRRSVTILELSQVWTEKPSFVNSDNKSVFVPPELSGLIEEPTPQNSNEREDMCSPVDMLKPVLQSPTKQRQNPFNIQVPPAESQETIGSQITNGAIEQAQTPSRDSVPTSPSISPHLTNPEVQSSENQASPNPPVPISTPIPVPRKRTTVCISHDSTLEIDESLSRQDRSHVPRGILKHNSSCSSADSLPFRLASNRQPTSQAPATPDSPTSPLPGKEPIGWLDRKQVRFSSAIGRGSPDLQDGKELGEHGMLDVDATAASAGNPKTVQEGVSRGREDDGKGSPVSPPQDEEEVSSCVGSPSCKEKLNSQTLVVGSTHVPVDQRKHDDSAEPSHPQVSDSDTAEQTPGKPLPPGSGTEDEGDPVADTRELFSHVTKRPAPKPEILTGSVLDAGSEGEDDSKESEESCVVSPNAKQELIGIYSESEVRENTSEESTQSPVEQEALVSEVEIFDASFSDAKTPSDADVSEPSHNASPKPRLLGIFSRAEEKEKSPETERAVKKETTSSSEERGLEDVMSIDSTAALQYQHETDMESDETLEKTEVPQPDLLSEDVTLSASSDESKVEHEVDTREVEADEFLKKLSNLKSFWGKENSGPKILIATQSSDSNVHMTSGDHCDQTTNSNDYPPKIEMTEASSHFQSPLLELDSSVVKTFEDTESPVDAFSVPPVVARTEIPPPLESSVLLNIASADGTFTARPILICDETDSSPEEAMADSQILTRPQGDSSSPVRPLSPSLKKPKGETGSHRRSLSQTSNTPESRIPKPKDSPEDELRKSPAKTCHPKALPRDVTNYNAGSPSLKTFPIDIVSPSSELEEERKSPSSEAKQALKSILKMTSSTTQPRRGSDQSALSSVRSPSRSIGHPGRRTSLGNINISSSLPRGLNHKDLTARRTSEGGVIGPQLPNRNFGKRKSLEDTGMGTHLARSLIPQIVQRVDRVPQGSDDPPFLQEQQGEVPKAILDAPVASVDVGDGGVGSCMDSKESRKTSGAEISILNVDRGSSRGDTPMVHSRAGHQRSYHGDVTPIRTKLKSMPKRPMSFSKSLEDLTSRSSTLPSRPPSLSNSDDMKIISTSVSAIPQDEKDSRDSDCTSENSLYLGWKRNANSLSNLSLSSGMVSMSSQGGSEASIYSGEHGDVEVKGSVQLALNYVQKLGEFHIFVVHCRELAVGEPKKNRSNPYIKCYLLPDKAKLGKKKTSVKNKTLNPTYNEILRFKVTMETLKTQNLNVSVWHNDTFGRNSFLGELDLNLTEWDFNNTQINEYKLKPRVSSLTRSPSGGQTVDSRGEMRVALRFLPKVSYSKRASKLEAGEVQVWVKDCKNLPPVRGVIIDPFVKCAVLPDSSRRTRQKTRVVKRTISPMFNHTMVYDGFKPDDLREIAVEITVWDHDRLSNHFIGGLRIGLGSGRSYGADVDWMDSTAEEVGLWERMIRSHSEWVESVLPLRMLLMATPK